jgi:hypothetical protein
MESCSAVLNRCEHDDEPFGALKRRAVSYMAEIRAADR